jgi:hypothetical protein
MVRVRAPMCEISTLVAEEAMLLMLWCSAYQIRRYPSSSARWASATLPAKLSLAVWPREIGARSRIDNGTRMMTPHLNSGLHELARHMG